MMNQNSMYYLNSYDVLIITKISDYSNRISALPTHYQFVSSLWLTFYL